MKHLLIFFLLLATLLPACTPSAQNTPLPVVPTFKVPSVPPPPTPMPTWTPFPTWTPLPTITPEPTPTATPTPLPLPDRATVLQHYQDELKPLASQLLGAGPAPASFSLPEEYQVILLPIDEKLFYAQELLFPDRSSGSSETPDKIYVLYEYQRGDDLGHFTGQGINVSRETQEVLVNQTLVAEVDGRRYKIEEKNGLGGSGSQGIGELVGNAIPLLESLPGEAEAVREALETVVGYACGSDWNDQIDSARKTALFLQALTSPYWSDRTGAISNLGRLASESAEVVPALITALQDKEDIVRDQAIETLGVIGPRAAEAVPVIIQSLKDNDPNLDYTRFLVANALAQIGPTAVPTLLQALSDPSPAKRAGAAEALGKMGDQEGVLPALVQALGDSDEDVSRSVSEALLASPAEQVVPLLIPLLGDQDRDIQRDARRILGGIGKPAVPALLEALQDTDPEIRHNAASSLGQIRDDKRVIPALLTALNDPEWIVRDAAAMSLGDLGAVEAIPALIQALSDPEEGVRQSAAWGLELIGEPAMEAVPALIQALSDPDKYVRESAMYALQAITGQDFGRDAAAWQNWWEAQTP